MDAAAIAGQKLVTGFVGKRPPRRESQPSSPAVSDLARQLSTMPGGDASSDAPLSAFESSHPIDSSVPPQLQWKGHDSQAIQQDGTGDIQNKEHDRAWPTFGPLSRLASQAMLVESPTPQGPSWPSMGGPILGMSGMTPLPTTAPGLGLHNYAGGAPPQSDRDRARLQRVMALQERLTQNLDQMREGSSRLKALQDTNRTLKIMHENVVSAVNSALDTHERLVQRVEQDREQLALLIQDMQDGYSRTSTSAAGSAEALHRTAGNP